MSILTDLGFGSRFPTFVADAFCHSQNFHQRPICVFLPILIALVFPQNIRRY
jgi:hypothetical protein